MVRRTSHDDAIVERLIQQIPAWPKTGQSRRSKYDRQGRLLRLDFSYLSLTTLFPEIGELHHLEELNLSYNSLAQVPAELGQLVQLRVLDLGNNQLVYLPTELKQLSQLQVLNLSHNLFTQMPEEIIPFSQDQVSLAACRKEAGASRSETKGKLTTVRY